MRFQPKTRFYFLELNERFATVDFAFGFKLRCLMAHMVHAELSPIHPPAIILAAGLCKSRSWWCGSWELETSIITIEHAVKEDVNDVIFL